MTTTGAISSVKLLSRVRLFATPWTAPCQASLSFTISWSLPKLMSIGSVTPCNISWIPQKAVLRSILAHPHLAWLLQSCYLSFQTAGLVADRIRSAPEELSCGYSSVHYLPLCILFYSVFPFNPWTEA